MRRWLLCLVLIVPSVLFAESSDTLDVDAPPLLTGLKVCDTPSDGGSSLDITWEPVEGAEHYEIYRKEEGGEWELIGYPPSTFYQDVDVENGKQYWYKIRAVRDGEIIGEFEPVGPAIPIAQWFNTKRLSVLVSGILVCALVLIYIKKARRGEELFIRKIAGLDAVDEAVGRSTEMGRPILFVLGLGDMTFPATLAGLAILGRVAKKAAEYETPILVPNYDPVVMVTAQEVVKQSCMEAGRPDLYNEKNITYLTQDQFGYTAGVDGIMMREKPGAVFLQGMFYAESLILAETGHSIGAIQIAGTTATAQLPFFVAACDYTLIGEEMYAASSYITRDPLMLGSLKGEDYAKMIIMLLVGLGSVFGTVAYLLSLSGNTALWDAFQALTAWFMPG